MHRELMTGEAFGTKGPVTCAKAAEALVNGARP
ncbi:hypothetical protein EDD90_9745 [Streptomyces sp. Ag109_O5-1]|nr:hypothetical protein EDD90_9745 [Streptomyces sp. Ag109_O5-1]